MPFQKVRQDKVARNWRIYSEDTLLLFFAFQRSVYHLEEEVQILAPSPEEIYKSIAHLPLSPLSKALNAGGTFQNGSNHPSLSLSAFA